MVKKCVEISDQCQLDIILVIKDRNTDRCREYHTSHGMTVPDLVKALELNDTNHTLKYERIFAGDDCDMDEPDKSVEKPSEPNEVSVKSEDGPQKGD